QVLCRRHLAGYELAPDQLVQTLGIAFHARKLGRAQVDVGRANRFVRFLRAFFARIDIRFFRQVLVAELALDETAHHTDRVSGKVGRVGTHVGDVTGFVQALSHHHGLLHTEAEAIARRLLQGRSDEGGRGLAARRFVFALADAVLRAL